MSTKKKITEEKKTTEEDKEELSELDEDTD
jgi:hypothetical protein